jgi:hypothetical protein
MMDRYRRRPAGADLAPPRNDHAEPLGPTTITVYEGGADYQATGVLNASGAMIERYVGLEPIGFLWDREAVIG